MSAACNCCPARGAGCKSGADTVAILGNPNSGKTTIFNALTGLHQKVGNYPGITVDKRSGGLRLDGRTVEVLDLPGIYSLVANSPDEQIVAKVLRGQRDGTPAPDVLVVVVDASNLPRNLYLASQLLDLGRPLVAALNMTDVAERLGAPVDPAALSRALDCQVVPLVGHRRAGIEALRAAIDRARAPRRPSYPLPRALVVCEERLSGVLRAATDLEDPAAMARRLLIGDPAPDVTALRRLAPVVAEEEHALVELRALGIDAMQAEIEARYRWIDEIVAGVVAVPRVSVRTRTEAVDRLLLHRVWGLLIFVGVMAVLFASVFWAAKPMMQGMQGGIALLAKLASGWIPAGSLRDLVRDGVFGGVGAVLMFVPQVAVLFALLATLEDSGYLARAAFLMDRLLARLGLHGKSFVPLLSCFACAIPGILSARTIENRRERLTTIFVAPFMTCSARLPVYTLLVAACLSSLGPLRQGAVMLGLYLFGIAAASATALLIRRCLDAGRGSPFIMEMPAYKLPQPSQVAWQAWLHTRSFVVRAGTTIFAFSVLLWAALYYPRLPADQAGRYLVPGQRAAAQVEYSLAGRFGHAIEPAVRPLGYDWRIAVGLVAAFAAREVFVSTLGITYSVVDAGEHVDNLSSAMQADRRADGRPVWTTAVALSLLAWFVLAMQCLGTLAVVRRETGGWRWPLLQILFMNGLAYCVAFGCYRVATSVWGG